MPERTPAPRPRSGDAARPRRAPSSRGAAPSRRPTLQDIADAAGVSPGLVSMVLRGRSGPSAATAAKVTDVAERLGYRANRLASQLASRRTRLLGVTMTPGNPYHGELVEEILASTHERGYEVLLAPVTDSHEERGAIETLVDSGCEALVLLNSGLTEDALALAVGGVPAVCVGRPLGLARVDVVRAADLAAMELLVEHLASLGHTRIAHVDGGPLYLPAERRLGFEEAMRRHGLEPLVVPGGPTEDDGARAAVELLGHAGVTATVAYNDLCAVGLMDHLQRNGIRIPADMSVTGFDDDRISGLFGISLTTVDPRKLEQARRAVDCALERVETGRSRRVVEEFAPRLVVRGSTAPPPPRRPRRSR